MGKKFFTVELTDNKVVYYGGDTINGNLVLDNDEAFSAPGKLGFFVFTSCFCFFKRSCHRWVMRLLIFSQLFQWWKLLFLAKRLFSGQMLTMMLLTLESKDFSSTQHHSQVLCSYFCLSLIYE